MAVNTCRHRRQSAASCWLARVLWLILVGCSAAESVSVDQAKHQLEAVLQAWQTGENANEVTCANQPVTIGDSDWNQGGKLLEYEFLSPGEFDGRNLRIPVRITVAPAQMREKRQQKTFSYIFSLQPKLTLFRDSD